MTKIAELVINQRNYFKTNKTLDFENRRKNLRKLKTLLYKYQDDIISAFQKDFNKHEFDVMTTEFMMVINEINFMLKNMKLIEKPKRVKTNLINFPSKSYKYYEPYGVVLIISPWNYPLQLSLVPLVGAIACGNTVILKPSELSPNVSCVMEKILSFFDDDYISVVLGGIEESTELLNQRFDLIFYTGSTRVGKIVMEKASKYLTPVVLELGGKSPCIVDKDVDLEIAAKRITWGKYLNAGQTCVAPDYVLVHKDIHQQFIQKVKQQIINFYYRNGKISNDFPYIINERHLERLKQLINPDKIIFGGDIKGRLMEPIIMDNISYDDSIMKEEIFGPIMPIMEYDDLDIVIEKLKSVEHPLALYVFSNNKINVEKVLKNVSFGGGCVNDTIMHLTSDELGFGGVGNSGMGNYHGINSLKTFSHEKSIFVKGKMEINLKYPPITDKKLNFINHLTKGK